MSTFTAARPTSPQSSRASASTVTGPAPLPAKENIHERERAVEAPGGASAKPGQLANAARGSSTVGCSTEAGAIAPLPASAASSMPKGSAPPRV